MGIVAFQWETNKLTLLQKREKLDSWVIEPAAWNIEEKILRGLPDNNLGTSCGISKKGRVAFLVDPMRSNNLSHSVLRPADVLLGNISPWNFANALSDNSHLTKMSNAGLVYHIVVADINSNSMFYVSKSSPKESHVHVEEVEFGVHTLSSAGFDSHFAKDLRLRNQFSEMIGNYTNRELPPMKEIAERFMHDPGDEADQADILFEPNETTGTTVFTVKPSKEVMFYEKFLEGGEWKEHHFSFSIE